MTVMEGVSILERLSWIANIIFHQGIAVITVYVLSVIFGNFTIESYTTWHVVLTTIGFMLLATEGLVLFNGSNIPTLYIKRDKKSKIHAILLGVGTVCVTIGISLKIYNKSSGHFESAHAIIGLASWIMLIISVILGVLASQSKSLGKLARPVIFKLVHIIVGLLALDLGYIALGFGMRKDAFQLFSSEKTVISAIVAMALLVIWSWIGAFRSAYSQIKSVFRK